MRQYLGTFPNPCRVHGLVFRTAIVVPENEVNILQYIPVGSCRREDRQKLNQLEEYAEMTAYLTRCQTLGLFYRLRKLQNARSKRYAQVHKPCYG